MDRFNEWMEVLNDFIVDNSAMWWVLPIVVFLCFIDGIIPPLPSDSVVVALAAVSVMGGHPNMILLGVAAAVGAFIGDQTAYTIGRYSRLERLTRSKNRRIRGMMDWAGTQLHRRGGVIIIAGRYLPVGRIAVNLSAGMTKYPRSTFIKFDMIAAVSWSIYCLLIGAFAGELFNRIAPGDNGPLLSAVFAVVLAMVVGYVVDRILARTTGAPVEAAEEAVEADEATEVSVESSEVAVAAESPDGANAVGAAEGVVVPGPDEDTEGTQRAATP